MSEEKKCVSVLAPRGLKATLCCCVVALLRCSAGCRRCSESAGSHREPETAQIDCDIFFLSSSRSLSLCSLSNPGVVRKSHSFILPVKEQRRTSCSLLLFLFCPPFYFSVVSECLTAPYYAPDTTRSHSLKIQICWTGCRRMTGLKKLFMSTLCTANNTNNNERNHRAEKESQGCNIFLFLISNVAN